MIQINSSLFILRIISHVLQERAAARDGDNDDPREETDSVSEEDQGTYS